MSTIIPLQDWQSIQLGAPEFVAESEKLELARVTATSSGLGVQSPEG